jgi:hypothetical protein
MMGAGWQAVHGAAVRGQGGPKRAARLCRTSPLLAVGVLAAVVAVGSAAARVGAAAAGARGLQLQRGPGHRSMSRARECGVTGGGVLCMALRGGGKKHREGRDHDPAADGYHEDHPLGGSAEKDRKEIVAERVAKAAEDLKETLKSARETVQVCQARA